MDKKGCCIMDQLNRVAGRDQEEECSCGKILKWILVCIAVAAAVAGIVYVISRFIGDDELEDFEEGLDDDFDDDEFFEDEEEEEMEPTE